MTSRSILRVFLVLCLLASSINSEKIECKFDYQTHVVFGETKSLLACSVTAILKGVKEIEISTVKINETNVVEVFDFSNSEIDFIPNEIFESFPSLIVLDASFSSLPSLRENTFENSSNTLKILDLSNNKIKQFTSYNGLSKLVELNLSHNRIKRISTFQNMLSLQILNMNANEISIIEEQVFIACTNLTQLKLSQNLILHIKNEFKGLKLLNELDLSENKLRKISENSLKDLISLKSLHLEKNAIAELDENVFSELMNLKFLYLQTNRITTLTPELLKNLINLEVFDASENLIEQFDKQLFANKKSLRILNLKQNKMVKKLEDGIFDNLGQLEQLNLDTMPKLAEITNSTFKGLLKLKTLQLGNNLIENIPPGAFDDLGNLIYLNLKGTSQTEISVEDLKPLKNLTKMELSYNVIFISPFAFGNLKIFVNFQHGYSQNFNHDLEKFFGNDIITVLSYSYLKKNEINSTEDLEMIVKLPINSCQNLKLPSLGNIGKYSIVAEEFAVLFSLSYPESVKVLNFKNVRIDVDQNNFFKNQTTLQELYIRDSVLSNVTRPLLAGLINLKVLDMSKSKILFIDDHSFADLINLKLLNLESNQINFTNENLLNNLTMLEGLFLSNNIMEKIEQRFLAKNTLLKEIYMQEMEMQDIHYNSFENLRELKVLDLRGNKLMTLSNSIFQPLASLVLLDLSKNKLKSLTKEMFLNLTNIKAIEMSENCCTYKSFDYFNSDLGIEQLDNSFSEISCDECQEVEDATLDKTVSCPTIKDPVFKTSCKPNNDYSTFGSYYCIPPQTFNLQVMIECETGYEISKTADRSDILTCLENGKWDKLPIICQPICSTYDIKIPSDPIQDELFVHLNHVSSQRVSLEGLKNINNITIQHKYKNDKTFTQYTEFNLPVGVKHLTIKNTEFNNVQNSGLANQTELEELYLNNNKLTTISRSMLTGLVNLQMADFSQSLIENVEENAFDDVKKLHTLKLNNNKIHFTNPNIFRNLVNLKNVYLSNNNIKSIDKDLFKNTKQLEEIEMKNMLLESIEDGAFKELENLKKLILYGNKLTFLSDATFEGLKSLNVLNLRNNAIKFLSPKTFSSMENLVELDLWDNVCIYEQFIGFKNQENIETYIANSSCIGCTVEELGKFGRGLEVIFGKNYTTGDRVQNFQSLKILCEPGYDFVKREKEDDVITCADNKWNKKFPLCIELCPGNETGGYTTQSRCSFKNEQISCDKDQAPGTQAEITCAVGYQLPLNVTGSELLTCMEGGKWDSKPVQCTPICGRRSAMSVPLIVGGQTTDIKVVPWQVAIYKLKSDKSGYKLICGGTILTKRIVLSASHCFYMDKELVRYPLEDYNIVVGKFLRLYDANETNPTQNFSISDLRTIPSYKGFSGYYISDFAIIILEGSIDFQPHILPICIDFNVRFGLDRLIKAGEIGLAAGWGNTKAGGIPSKVLKSIEMPVVDFFQCRKEAGDFEPFVTPDKFCSGFKNGSGVCSGDSGGGLVFPRQENGETVYYIKGIVSNGKYVEKTNKCDSFYTLFTNVLEYIPFVKSAIEEFP